MRECLTPLKMPLPPKLVESALKSKKWPHDGRTEQAPLRVAAAPVPPQPLPPCPPVR